MSAAGLREAAKMARAWAAKYYQDAPSGTAGSDQAAFRRRSELIMRADELEHFAAALCNVASEVRAAGDPTGPVTPAVTAEMVDVALAEILSRLLAERSPTGIREAATDAWEDFDWQPKRSGEPLFPPLPLGEERNDHNA